MYEQDFDEKGNTICERTYGADGEMTARKAGYDEVNALKWNAATAKLKAVYESVLK